MKDDIELVIEPGGKIRTIYQDGIEIFAKAIGADIVSVCRLSTVEWETINGKSGWAVRSARDPNFAIRISEKHDDYNLTHVSLDGDIVLFATREDALQAESNEVWTLLNPTQAAKKVAP